MSFGYKVSLAISACVLLIGRQSSPIGSWFTIIDWSDDQWVSAIAYNSLHQEYLVVWSDSTFIGGQRVTSTGTLAGPPILITTTWSGTSHGAPSVTYNSQHDEYLVVWAERDASIASIRGRRVSANGWLPGEIITIVCGAVNDVYCTYPGVAYASTVDKYLVIYQYGNLYGWLQYGIAAQAFNHDGSADGSGFDIRPYGMGSDMFGPRLAYNRARNELLVVWTEVAGPSYDVLGRRVKMTGGAEVVGSIFKISNNTDTLDEIYMDVAALPFPNGIGQYLVTWASYTSDSEGDIYGKIVAGDGTVSNDSPIAIAVDPVGQTLPAVSGSESSQHYLVTWRQASNPPLLFVGIRGQAVSSQGTLLWPVSGIGGLFASYAAVAAGPNGDFLIAYNDQPYTDDQNVYGRLWGNRTYLPLMFRVH